MEFYWLTPLLAIISRPKGNDWLDDEMASLKRQGVDVVISCLTESEEKDLGLREEKFSAEQHQLDFVGLAIEDRGTPENTLSFISTINRLVSQNKKRRIVVHCRQSLGRAPLVAAAILVRSGMTPDQAWQLIAEQRNQVVPETEDQREWINLFAHQNKLSMFAQSS